MSQPKEFPKTLSAIIAANFTTLVTAIVIALATSGCDPANQGAPDGSKPPTTKVPTYLTQDYSIQGKLQSVLIPLALVNDLSDDSEKLMDATYKPNNFQMENQSASEFVPDKLSLQVRSYVKLGSTSDSWRSCTTTIQLTPTNETEFSRIFKGLFFCEHTLSSSADELPACSGLIGPGYLTQITFLDAENKQKDLMVEKEFSRHCHPPTFHSYCHNQQSDLLTHWAQSIVVSKQPRERNCSDK